MNWISENMGKTLLFVIFSTLLFCFIVDELQKSKPKPDGGFTDDGMIHSGFKNGHSYVYTYRGGILHDVECECWKKK